MEPYADASCVLKVDTNCDACKFKTIEAISSVTGVYSINIDAEENLVKICGEVDPNRLLIALAREGKHAEIVKANLKHPGLRTQYYPTYGHGYSQGRRHSHGYGYGYGGHGYSQDLSAAYHHPHHAFPIRGALPHRAHYPSDYCTSSSWCGRARPFGF